MMTLLILLIHLNGLDNFPSSYYYRFYYLNLEVLLINLFIFNFDRIHN